MFMNSASMTKTKSSMYKRLSLMTLAVAICCTNSLALAHHPIQAKFEASTPVNLSGIVTNVDWSNPHVHVFVNVTDNGVTQNWAIELENPITLGAGGWSKTTVKPGDSITVEGIRARDGSRQAWGESVKISNGNEAFAMRDTAPAAPATKRPAPRWPDGKIALGATSAAANGYWGYPTETALVEDGVSVEMDKYGQLANLADAPKVAPLQPWALGVYQHRQ